MRKMKKRSMAALVLALALLCGGCASENSSQARPQGERQEALYYGPWSTSDSAVQVDVSPEQENWYIPAGGSVEIGFCTEEAGSYALLLTYRTERDVTLRSVMGVSVDGEECLTQMVSVWRDETKEYGEDRYGNQLAPSQITENSPVTDYVSDQSGISARPYEFELAAGDHTLTISSEDIGVTVSGVKFVKQEELPSYEAYAADFSGAQAGSDCIVIEGEDYSVKSDSSIRAGSVRMSALSPYDYSRRLLNVLDGASYDTVGQKVQYSFTVETAGLYQIAFHYQQDGKEGIPVYQNVRIDGRTLFGEMQSVPFAYTGVKFGNAYLEADGEPAAVYLEAGQHTILLEADGTPVQEAVARLETVMNRLSEIGLEIKKLAGTQADSNRTWDVESYLPGVIQEISDSETELREVYDLLGTLQEKQPAAALEIRQAANNLEQILSEPDKIPGKLSLLSEGSGSATQLLADQIDKLKSQNLTLDAIYIQGGEADYRVNESFLQGIVDDVKRFFHALFLDENTGEDDDVLEVWINRPLQYMEVLQTMADTEFTAETGIEVRFTLMSSEQRIILSNSTDLAPDVVMGLATNTPFDLGLRGAVVDLTQFDGFAETMSEYNPESLTPYILGDQVFGATETQDFYVLIYRTDIFDQLGLEVPETWDDVRDMMPVLQRNSMNFYLQLSGYTGTKPLYSTAPFLMQAGGGIYADGDASTTAVNSAASLKGFETLTDLYRLYSVQSTVSSFYNSFRYGQIPAGIGSFSDYVKIKNAAPEIADKWAVAPAPGMVDENGEVQNGTTGASSACAILSGSDKQQEAWQFLQWWLSADVQTEFGNTLQTTYGAEYLWNSANIEAFSQLNFPEEDKAVILEQWSQMKEINRHPALYVVERELSNAWQEVVEGNTPARIALDDAATTINREFERKLTEFGYFDSDGNELKPFVYTPAQEILEELTDENN